MTTVEEVIIRQRAFAQARDWEQFHSPKNLSMALGGEVGELCVEIEPLLLETPPNLTPEGLESVRHEIADVALYLLRLYDVVQINPPGSFPQTVGHGAPVDSSAAASLGLARAVCRLSGAVGLLLEVFQWEDGASHALPSRIDRAELGNRLDRVWTALNTAAGLLGIDVAAAAVAKIDANERRYPVASSRGSSRKYTELPGEGE
ncbi:nucleotide pyrophosphohydrolase [Rhodococcus erythropolis]|nr:nucleotide pyrophosphohydrolase [Rhodococcus erythropolis]